MTLAKLSLPPDPDPKTVYVGSGRVAGADAPFVRAVWFTPEVADTLSGQPDTTPRQRDGQHEQVCSELYHAWYATRKSVMRSDATQPASGTYTELGLGSMPGTGREYVLVDGRNTNVPYTRNQPITGLLEPLLAEFMSDVSEVLHCTHACSEPILLQSPT